MKTILLTLILSCSFLSAQAQTDGYALEQLFIRSNTNVMIGYKHDYNLIMGHPYLHSEWSEGSFRTNGGAMYSNVKMKFESNSGLLAIFNDTDSLFMKPSVVAEFQYTHKGIPYQFKNGFYDRDVDLDIVNYLHVLSEGPWSIYRHYKKDVKPANFDPVFNTGSRFDRLVEESRYLVKSPDGKWSEINPNRRNLTRLFGDHGRDVVAYARANHLQYDEDEDLIQIFEHASALIQP